VEKREKPTIPRENGPKKYFWWRGLRSIAERIYYTHHADD